MVQRGACKVDKEVDINLSDQFLPDAEEEWGVKVCKCVLHSLLYKHGVFLGQPQYAYDFSKTSELYYYANNILDNTICFQNHDPTATSRDQLPFTIVKIKNEPFSDIIIS